MERTYKPLTSHAMAPQTSYQQPVLPPAPNVDLDDAAADVMTDFHRVRAITVPATVSMDYASERMRANRVHLLLVTDERNTIIGLITSTDIEGERPLVHMRQFAMRRDELSVADIMTPSERIEVIEMADVVQARVGHVVATLKAVGRQHAMVVDRDDAGRSIVCGLFAVSQLNRQLGEPFDPVGIARSFAEVEMALAYH
jgi:CBS-domain-containing membrane protein